MKRAAIISLIVALAVLATGVVYAHGTWGHGTNYNAANVDVDTLKKFQKETLSLRDEMLTKKFELQNEYNKPVPDANRIGILRKEIIDIQTKIQAVADKYGLTTAGYMAGMMGQGQMNHGMNHGMMGCPCSMCQ